jgi:NitT/TauT family transport system substrate-binding protein
MRLRETRKRARLAIVTSGLVITLAATACSGSQSGSSNSTSNAAGEMTTLTIAQPSKALDFMQLYIGIAKGFFKQQGLQVNLVATGGPATVNYVISGQADMAAYAIGTTVQADDAGKTLPIIYTMEANLATGLAVKKGITTIAQLKAVSGCTLAAGTPGTQGYYTARYYIQRLGLTNCRLVSSSSDPAEVAGITSGSYTAADLSISASVGAAKDGLKLLIDPGNPQDLAKYLPSRSYPVVNIFGLASHLSAKRSAIIRFISALKKTQKYMDSAPLPQLAQDLVKSGQLPGATEQELAAELTNSMPYLTTKLNQPQGFISQSDWDYALTQLTDWGLSNYVVNNPKHQYGVAIDMSYYDAAK